MSSKKKKGDGDSDGDDGGKGAPMHPLLVALYVMFGAFVVVVLVCGGLYYYRSRQQLSARCRIFTVIDDAISRPSSWAASYFDRANDSCVIEINGNKYTMPMIRKQFFILADAIQTDQNGANPDTIIEMLASKHGTDETNKKMHDNVYRHLLPQVLNDRQRHSDKLKQLINDYHRHQTVVS